MTHDGFDWRRSGTLLNTAPVRTYPCGCNSARSSPACALAQELKGAIAQAVAEHGEGSVLHHQMTVYLAKHLDGRF